MIGRVFIFLMLNFAALAIGGLFTSSEVTSEWYVSLNKAPWTPPGWVFGAAWTSIMIAFSIYMAWWWKLSNNKRKVLYLYALQWCLNVSWNPAFFYFKLPILGLILILGLTLLIAYFLFQIKEIQIGKRMTLLPYFIWLIIASSLNLFIVVMN